MCTRQLWVFTIMYLEFFKGRSLSCDNKIMTWILLGKAILLKFWGFSNADRFFQVSIHFYPCHPEFYMIEITFSALVKNAFVSIILNHIGVPLKFRETTSLRFSGISFTLLDEIFKLLNEMWQQNNNMNFARKSGSF